MIGEAILVAVVTALVVGAVTIALRAVWKKLTQSITPRSPVEADLPPGLNPDDVEWLEVHDPSREPVRVGTIRRREVHYKHHILTWKPGRKP